MHRFVLAALLCAVACKESVPALTPAAERFDCHARALAPLAPSAEQARVLTYEVYAGTKSLAQVLAFLNASAPAIKAYADAVRECERPAPSADASPDARSAE